MDRVVWFHVEKGRSPASYRRRTCVYFSEQQFVARHIWLPRLFLSRAPELCDKISPLRDCVYYEHRHWMLWWRFSSETDILCIYLSMDEGTSKTATPNFSSTLSQTRTHKLPSRTKRSIAPSSEMCSLVTVRGPEKCGFLRFESHFFLRTVLLISCSPVPIPKRHMCWGGDVERWCQVLLRP